MKRILLGLLLFPLTALGDEATAPSPVRAEFPQVIAVEVTVLELSAHLEIADANDIDPEKLKQAIADARASGVLESLTRFRLSTIAGRQSTVEVGKQEAMISGWTTAGNQKLPSYTYELTGSVLGVLAELTEQGKIAVSVDLEQTRLLPGKPANDDPAETTFPRKRKHIVKTTSIIPDGDTIVVSGSQQVDADSDQLETIVLLRASTVD